MSLQDNIQRLRKSAGFKQASDLAEFIKIPYTSYLAYEKKGTWPSEENIIKIASALHCTIDELLGYTPNEYEQCKKMIKPAFTVEEIPNEKDYVRLGKLRKRGDGYTYFCRLSKSRFIEIVHSANTLPRNDFFRNLYILHNEELIQQEYIQKGNLNSYSRQ